MKMAKSYLLTLSPPEKLQVYVSQMSVAKHETESSSGNRDLSNQKCLKIVTLIYFIISEINI